MMMRVPGIDIPIEVSRSRRRKTIGISVKLDGSVVVNAPKRLSQKRVAEALQRKAMWIEGKRRKVREMSARFSMNHRFVSGESVWYLGEELSLQVRSDATSRVPQVTLAGTTLEVVLAADLPDEVRDSLVAWYRQHAQDYLTERVVHYGERVGLTPNGVSIAEWRRKWGQCKTDSQNLRFNWRIIQTPPTVVDYLVVHELMHLRESNHSREFWHLVRSILPDYEERRRWLKDWGAPLLLFCDGKGAE